MIHDDLCRVNNATTNAAISMAMEVLLCPLFVSGVVVERRAQSDNVSYIGYTCIDIRACDFRKYKQQTCPLGVMGNHRDYKPVLLSSSGIWLKIENLQQYNGRNYCPDGLW